MNEDFRVIENYLMVKMPEEIDHHRSDQISREADKFIVHRKINNIVFDFGATRFMDSSGIGVIIGRYKKVSCFGGKIYAVNPDKQIRRILKMSGLQKIIEIME